MNGFWNICDKSLGTFLDCYRQVTFGLLLFSLFKTISKISSNNLTLTKQFMQNSLLISTFLKIIPNSEAISA